MNLRRPKKIKKEEVPKDESVIIVDFTFNPNTGKIEIKEEHPRRYNPFSGRFE